MNLLLSVLKELPEYEKLRRCVEKAEPVCVSGLGGLHRAQFAAGLTADTGRPMVLLCQDDLAAKKLAEMLGAFLGKQPPVLPTRDLTLHDATALSHEWEQRSIRLLYDLGRGDVPLLVTSVQAFSRRTIPPATLYSSAVRLQPGAQYDPDTLADRLQTAGYTRCTLVEGPGQYALRGGILDVFSPAHDQPVRVEFFGDELDCMGYFDPVTQRRTENIDAAVLLPVAESVVSLHPNGRAGLCEDLRALAARQRRRKNPNAPLIETLERDASTLESGLPFPSADRYMALIYPEFATAASYLSAETCVVFCDHGNLARAAEQLEEELGMELDGLLQTGLIAGELCAFYDSWDDLCRTVARFAVVYFDSFLATRFPQGLAPKELLSVTAKQLPSYGGSIDTAVSDLQYYQKNNFRTLVLTGNRRRGEILQQTLAEKGASAVLAYPAAAMPEPGQIFLTEGTLPGGVEYPSIGFAVLSEGQLTTAAAQRPKRKKKLPSNRQKLKSFTDLVPGDLVVHEYHGIGRYMGMEQIPVDGITKDYVKIAYSGTDVLYVPAMQLDLISKYIGGGEDAPVRLNKLGGDAWQKTKARAKAAAKDLAAGLIKLYAERKRLPGFAFAEDTPWQQEFEDSFEYAETDDQLRAIAEIKGDMESPAPMDRLLCGDVGFGKTEVALRAAMKCIMDGKQCAILVPTTVLAQQHYVTAMKRFGGFPVNIDVLSRFRTAAQQKKTLADLAVGNVDLIIGTHKLLQKSVQFKDLGLLIVDEEQRFGVTHKERLKELSAGVDSLTLSATPIPRTLNMALSGLRDMSTLEEPPSDRYPVQTFVLEHDDRILIDAIRRELARGGQVYYLHNRVDSIDRCAMRLREKLGEDVTVTVAHGKMSEDQLGEVMQRMSEGEIQVLVCTTIIETGIDISNANTLIIEDADRLGLSQLHQIRGRVGRSNRHAFAYLTFRRGKVLNETAEKRLEAIREFAAFGSGFKIAMRDLEIRGAGNLLGAEQSGHMMSVGYDMYLKLLEEAVLEQRGDKEPEQPACTADLNVAASVQKNYVSSGEQRMDLYRRMAAIRTQEDADDLLDEIVDRYGDPPRGVMNLIDIALLRARAAANGICEITQKGDSLTLKLKKIDLGAVSGICADPVLKTRVRFSAGATPEMSYRLSRGEDSLKASRALVDKFAALSIASHAADAQS